MDCLAWIVYHGLSSMECPVWIVQYELSSMDCLSWIVLYGLSSMYCLVLDLKALVHVLALYEKYREKIIE